MKKYINRVALLSCCVMAFSACDDNSWNDKLDGFDSTITGESQTVSYTMQAADYKQLAGLSANKALAAADDNAAALSAVGTQGYFTDAISPIDYLPAFLGQESFPYFALPDGSSVKVTYNIATGLPEEITDIANAYKYTVSEADYQNVWESTTDYAEAFAPSHTAAKSIPGILKTAYPDAFAGDYVIVNYNTSATDPNFGGSAPEVPSFTQSSVLGSFAKGDALDINGVVMAVSTQGPVIADAAGSIFAYLPANNADLKVGDQVSVSSTVSSYNYGYQLASGADAEVKGSQAVTYPTAKTWTGAEIDAYVAAAMATGADPVKPVYSKFTGKVTVSGNYINIVLDGTNVQVSPYGANATVKSLLVDGSTVDFEGYVCAIASKGKYLNTIITKVGSTSVATLAAASKASRAGVAVASTNENALYYYNGSAWTAATNAVVLSHADYQAMGQRYDNLSGTTPASLLPIFLKQKYPYAQVDEVKNVAYYYYNGSETVTRCDQYSYNGSEWTLNNGIVTETSQFVKKSGKWLYSPDVTINLPAGKGIAISTLYYQTCVDWIAANVTDGPSYVSSYGNNEYYCGTSAYQGNVDLRPSAARTQNSAAYESMTDDEIVALEKERFEKEVFPAALAILHADAAPVNGINPVFTINFYYYTGTTQAATIIYNVTAPATFEFVSCTWNEE